MTPDGFYGTDCETYFVNPHGVVWIVQSVDFASDDQFERILELPADAVPLRAEVLDDWAFNLPDYVYETTAETRP